MENPFRLLRKVASGVRDSIDVISGKEAKSIEHLVRIIQAQKGTLKKVFRFCPDSSVLELVYHQNIADLKEKIPAIPNLIEDIVFSLEKYSQNNGLGQASRVGDVLGKFSQAIISVRVKDLPQTIEQLIVDLENLSK